VNYSMVIGVGVRLDDWIRSAPHCIFPIAILRIRQILSQNAQAQAAAGHAFDTSCARTCTQ
jgi:hypothetical protein